MNKVFNNTQNGSYRSGEDIAASGIKKRVSLMDMSKFYVCPRDDEIFSFYGSTMPMVNYEQNKVKQKVLAEKANRAES